MRLLIQRVQKAEVFIQQQMYSRIDGGLLVFLGIHKDDKESAIKWLIHKLIHLRIFNDENNKMNLSIKKAKGEILLVSQFTLYGSCLNGRRPDFIQAAPPVIALPLYEAFIQHLKLEMPALQTGVFGAEMQISLINDGPVTFLIDSEKK